MTRARRRVPNTGPSRGGSAAIAAEHYKAFPPGWGHVQIPMTSRTAALAALTLYAPCRAGGRAVRAVAWATVQLGGRRLLPGRSQIWSPLVPESEWSGLRSQWQEGLGPFDEVIAYTQPQASRRGGAFLLLRDGRPTAFVKLRRSNGEQLINERRALELVDRAPTPFWTPRPLAWGTSTSARWLAMTALPLRPHGPARRPALDRITRVIERTLASLPRPRDTPAHWLPMHGDLTPWNLRMLGRHQVLIDWEDAGWGPPGADAAYFRAVTTALWGWDPGSAPGEAVQFWRDRIRDRHTGGGDGRLLIDLDRALVRMGPRDTGDLT